MMNKRSFLILLLCCCIVFLVFPTTNASNFSSSSNGLYEKIKSTIEECRSTFDGVFQLVDKSVSKKSGPLFSQLVFLVGKVMDVINTRSEKQSDKKLESTDSSSITDVNLKLIMNLCDKFTNVETIRKLFSNLRDAETNSVKKNITIELVKVIENIGEQVKRKGEKGDTLQHFILQMLKQFKELNHQGDKLTNDDFKQEVIQLMGNFFETISNEFRDDGGDFEEVSKMIEDSFKLLDQVAIIITTIIILGLSFLKFIYTSIRSHKVFSVVFTLVYLCLLIVSVIVIAPHLQIEKLWKIPQCPRSINVLYSDPNSSNLILNSEALNTIRSLQGPIYAISWSGEFLTGKSTATSLQTVSLLPSKVRERCSRFFDKRSDSSDCMFAGKTKGMSVIAIPLSIINVDDLPESMKEPLQAIIDQHEQPTGTILILDTQGVNDPKAAKGQSELIQILSILISTHHTSLFLSRFHSKEGSEHIAKLGQFMQMAETLSKPHFSSECDSWGGLAFKQTQNTQFSFVVRNSESFGVNKLVTCANFSPNGHLTDIPNNCSLFVNFLNGFHESLSNLPKEENILINKYFRSTEALIQPSLVEGEYDLLNNFPTNPKLLESFIHGNQKGVIYSLIHHLFPRIYSSMIPFTVNSKIIDGRGYATFIEGTFNALKSIQSIDPSILSVNNVPQFQKSILNLMNQLVRDWERKSVRELINQLPIESTFGCSTIASKEKMCPPELAERAFNESKTTLLRSVCVLQSLLNNNTLNEFYGKLDMVLTETKPIIMQMQLSKCGYEWNVEPWSTCKGECNGYQTRSVSCLFSPTRETRPDKCCTLFTNITEPVKRVCDPPSYTFEWVKPTDEEFPENCNIPRKCEPSTYPKYADIPPHVIAGEKSAPYWCRRCGEKVDNSHCEKAIGQRPQDVKKKCFPNQAFWTAGDWSPSNNQCTCKQVQKQPIACENCYGDKLPIFECEKHALNSRPTERKCAGYEWRDAGWTECSGNCGQMRTVSKCFPCLTNVPVENHFCAHHPKPTESVKSCQPIFKWNYIAWPNRCKCNSKLTREVSCINLCNGQVTDNFNCVNHIGNRPEDHCFCKGCPTKQVKWYNRLLRIFVPSSNVDHSVYHNTSC